MYRQMLLARAVDERMWLMQRAGKIAFIISGQGHEGAQVGVDLADAPQPRLDGALLPLHRRHHDLRHERGGHHHRPPGQGRRRQLRRAPDAGPLRRGAVQHRERLLAGRHPGAPRGGHRHGRLGARRRRRGHHLLRRGNRQPGRDPRGDELRRRAQAAGDLRLREQRLRDQRPAQPAGRRPVRRGTRPGLRVPGRDRGWRRRRWAATPQHARRTSGRAHGEGPTLIEARVVRLTSHSSDDDQRRYRDPAEMEALKGQDP